MADILKSIADLLDGPDPKGEELAELTAESIADDAMSETEVIEALDAKGFSLTVLNSRRFRNYINHALTMGSLPAAVAMRFMDYGWGKPPDRVEHTGKDGGAIESITEVRRVIVHVGNREKPADTPSPDAPASSYTTH